MAAVMTPAGPAGSAKPVLGIADDFPLPLAAVTETFAILGRRGSGKTTTAAVLVEEMLAVGAQVVVIDPLDAWWGLRSARDGQGAGLPIVVLGGAHGDLPLDAGNGHAVADLAVELGVSAILSLRHLSKTQQRAFVVAFAERLYARKGEPGRHDPLFLVVDEASLYAPQRVTSGQERLLGAIGDIGRRGRTSGLGLALIDQRAASVNKDVLSQTEVLLVGQTTSSHDRAAIRDWIAEHADPEQQAALLGSLPSLAVGEFWVCSPSWLHVFRRVRIRPRRTFDSSATPRLGDVRVEPRHLAPVDLDALRRHLAADSDDADGADDNAATGDLAALRQRISTLERELQAARAQTRTVIERVEVPAISGEDLAQFTRLVDGIADVAQRLQAALAGIPVAGQAGTPGVPAIAALPTTSTPTGPAPAPPVPRQTRTTSRRQRPRPPDPPAPSPSLSEPQRRILDALAWFEALGVRQPARGNVAVFSDTSPSSGAYGNNLGRLRTLGLVDYPAQGHVALTEAGRAQASPPPIEASLDALHAAWYAKLPPRQEGLLRLAIAAYPHPVSRDDLAGLAGVSPSSGSYGNNLGALRSLGVIDYPKPGQVVATALLFPDLTTNGSRP